MSSSKLSQSDILYLYDFLCRYEQELKNQAGTFDINNLKLDKYLKEQDIYLGALNAGERKKSTQHRFYILYDQRANNKASGGDKIHHLLRHVRNAIAHNLVSKGRKQMLSLQDKSKDEKMAMEGHIRAEVFYALLDLLIESKK